jgi:uncharacterized membrane protein YphA (DoxX/SURF4 family)
MLSQKARTREALALVILRLGLAWFLFVWAVNKILAPGQYERIWGYFHGIEIGSTMPYVMGAAQIAVCIAMALGLWRVITYAAGFLMHAVTVAVIAENLIMPFVIADGFPTNRNQAIALAALAGFAALWLLRHRDHWSMDVWISK